MRTVVLDAVARRTVVRGTTAVLVAEHRATAGLTVDELLARTGVLAERPVHVVDVLAALSGAADALSAAGPSALAALSVPRPAPDGVLDTDAIRAWRWVVATLERRLGVDRAPAPVLRDLAVLGIAHDEARLAGTVRAVVEVARAAAADCTR